MEGIGFAGNLAGHHLKYPAISGTWRGALDPSDEQARHDLPRRDADLVRPLVRHLPGRDQPLSGSRVEA